jgi:hypothetical protein
LFGDTKLPQFNPFFQIVFSSSCFNATLAFDCFPEFCKKLAGVRFRNRSDAFPAGGLRLRHVLAFAMGLIRPPLHGMK